MRSPQFLTGFCIVYRDEDALCLISEPKTASALISKQPHRPSLWSQNVRAAQPDQLPRKSPAAHCIFGAQGLGFEQCSCVDINSSAGLFGSQRRTAICIPRKFKLSAITLSINEASFLAKRCCRNRNGLCFHLCES